jgi:hypothetical protein
MDAPTVERAADADFQRLFDRKNVRLNLRLGARYAVHFHQGDARIVGFELIHGPASIKPRIMAILVSL